jgi:hypothetical protein
MSVSTNDVTRVLGAGGAGGAGAIMLPNTGDGLMAKIVPLTCIAVGALIMVWMIANRVVRRVVVARSTKA